MFIRIKGFLKKSKDLCRTIHFYIGHAYIYMTNTNFVLGVMKMYRVRHNVKNKCRRLFDAESLLLMNFQTLGFPKVRKGHRNGARQSGDRLVELGEIAKVIRK